MNNDPQQPPEQPPRKKRSPLFWAVVAIGITLVIIGSVVYASHPASTPLSGPAFRASATDTTIATLDKNGNANQHTNVHFICTILDFVKDSNGNTAGANVDDPDSSGVVLVAFPIGTDLSQLNRGDTIEVWGIDDGVSTGKNAFGGDVQEVGITIVSMTDQTTGYGI